MANIVEYYLSQNIFWNVKRTTELRTDKDGLNNKRNLK